VGSAAQTKAMKRVAGKLRLDLAQFRELASFAQFGSDLDEATKSKIERGKRMVELLKQKQFAPLSFARQVIVLFIGTTGLIDDVKVSEIQSFEKGFLEYLDQSFSHIEKAILDSKDLTDDSKKL
jgi:F-type H+-transporting ATPase subunit alpha